ncbi:MAG TPA: hypothetical protein VK131_02885 [Candidatus Acidoferrales bacterium]|nr:hypothetical protein [Candidatus Acidoferrales bacterium]
MLVAGRLKRAGTGDGEGLAGTGLAEAAAEGEVMAEGAGLGDPAAAGGPGRPQAASSQTMPASARIR